MISVRRHNPESITGKQMFDTLRHSLQGQEDAQRNARVKKALATKPDDLNLIPRLSQWKEGTGCCTSSLVSYGRTSVVPGCCSELRRCPVLYDVPPMPCRYSSPTHLPADLIAQHLLLASNSSRMARGFFLDSK